MSLLTDAISAIRTHRDDALGRGIELIGVFGSVARGEQGPASDVDVAYDVVGRASLLDVAHLMLELQSDLGRRVDMVDVSEARPAIRARIEQDLVRA